MNKQIPFLVAVVGLILILWLIFRGSANDSYSEEILFPDIPEAPAIPEDLLGQ